MAGFDDDFDDGSADSWESRLAEWWAHCVASPAVRWLTAIVLVVGAIEGTAWKVCWAPKLDRLADLERQHRALAHAARRLHAQAASVASLQSRHDGLMARLSDAARALSGPGDIEALLASLNRAALRLGLNLELIQPRAIESGAEFAELPLAIRASGSYSRIAAWMADVAALPGFVTLRRLDLHAQADGARVILDAVAVAHLRPEAGTSIDGAQASSGFSAGLPADPFGKDRLTSEVPYAEEIVMVGVLRDGRRRYGVVRMGNDIAAVRVGQTVGHRGGRVIRIDDDALAWREPATDGAGQGARQWIDRTTVLQPDRPT